MSETTTLPEQAEIKRSPLPTAKEDSKEQIRIIPDTKESEDPETTETNALQKCNLRSLSFCNVT